jgi:hypothetical protein
MVEAVGQPTPFNRVSISMLNCSDVVVKEMRVISFINSSGFEAHLGFDRGVFQAQMHKNSAFVR